MNDTLLSDLSELFFHKRFYLCPCCNAVSTNIDFIMRHIWKCTGFQKNIPIIVNGTESD